MNRNLKSISQTRPPHCRPLSRKGRGEYFATCVFAAVILVSAQAGRAEGQAAWKFYSEIPLDAGATAKWHDFVVNPQVFDQARGDLGDLRLHDADGKEVPYALRILTPISRDEPLVVKEYNRVAGPDQSAELSLELGEQPDEHNNVEVVTAGSNFRRHAKLEGSADNVTWRTVAEADLLNFSTRTDLLLQQRIIYSPSRFRYLRIHVNADPTIDNKPVEITKATVFHNVQEPGELLTLDTVLGPREPVKADAGNGSAWTAELGARNVPVASVEVQIADDQFARDYAIESLDTTEPTSPFWQRIGGGSWRRRAGQTSDLQTAQFSETLAQRLRIMVTDFRNPPLKLNRVRVLGPARQIVFERSSELKGPLRLYYGNPLAEPPHYDIERNLPAKLIPIPARLTLGVRVENPEFVPTPMPITERWPWLIYVVLGGACMVLAAIIVDLGRRAIALHDENQLKEKISPGVT